MSHNVTLNHTILRKLIHQHTVLYKHIQYTKQKNAYKTIKNWAKHGKKHSKQHETAQNLCKTYPNEVQTDPGSDSCCLFFLAGGLGLEPRLTESESAVLPLDDPPKPRRHIDTNFCKTRNMYIFWHKLQNYIE